LKRKDFSCQQEAYIDRLKKILNPRPREQIAIRIMRAANEMGKKTARVAEEDIAGARNRFKADEALQESEAGNRARCRQLS